MTIGLPGSGSAFVLMMNRGVYGKMSAQEKAWVDEASGKWLSLSGGGAYKKAARAGIAFAKQKGVEIITLSDAERARANAAIAEAMAAFRARKMRGGKPGGEVYDTMTGK